MEALQNCNYPEYVLRLQKTNQLILTIFFDPNTFIFDL